MSQESQELSKSPFQQTDFFLNSSVAWLFNVMPNLSWLSEFPSKLFIASGCERFTRVPFITEISLRIRVNVQS